MSSQSNPAFEGDVNNTGKKSSCYTIELKNAEKEKEAEYNPFEHRDVTHPTTNSETLLHLLKGSLGTGILAMPSAFMHAGYALGIAATFIIGLLCLYCIHLLINAEHELCRRKKKPSMSYPETATEALLQGPPFLQKLSPFAADIVNAFLLVYQLGTCCVYVVFIATNVKDVMDLYIGEADVRIYMLVFLLPLILINLIRNLKYLAPFSTIANIITAVSFGIIFYYLIDKPPTFENREPVGALSNMPLFFGTVLFALEAIGVIMPLENEMKTPKDFAKPLGVLNIGMGTIIILYVIMGLLGYLAYGSSAEDSITLNLTDAPLAQVVKMTLAFAIYVTHSLQCYVAMDILWTSYVGSKFEKNEHKLLYEHLIRTSLVIVTFLLAVAIPKLGLFISLFGALTLSALGLAIPAIVDMSTKWYTSTPTQFKIIIVKDTLLILFALFGLVVGTYTSISDIIWSFTHENPEDIV